MVKQIFDKSEKKRIARFILESLSDWFGIPESREEYIKDSEDQPFFAVFIEGRPVGFLCLKETGKDTVELSVMGVLKEFHRHGMGRALFEAAKDYSIKNGYQFLQVKTVQMGRYAEYDNTNHFYISMGLKEFEVFPKLWDECNPCQIYVMSLQ